MNHEDAVARAEQHNAQERGERHWFARRREDGSWEVVAVAGAATRRTRPLSSAVEARPEPGVAPDPRPSISRDLPAYGS